MVKKKSKPATRRHRHGTNPNHRYSNTPGLFTHDIPEEFTHASRGERLQKIMARAGVASRRDCESLIAQGHVTVNHHLVTSLPIWVDPTIDRIAVNGHLIKRPDSTAKTNVYVAVNKPRGVVSTSRDPEKRPCVIELVDLPTRLFPVGRLDADSTGLILLTNDGKLANRLTHPRYEITKQYHVSVRGHITAKDLQTLKKGLYLAHTKRSCTPRDKRDQTIQTKLASMARVKLIGYGRGSGLGDRTNLAVTLKEGQNREIRRMLARLGYKVRRLERIKVGPIQVKGLAMGQWRLLSSREINLLKRITGLIGESNRQKKKMVVRH